MAHLASDQMEGRGVGTAGLDAAGQYIAGYLKALGLQPLPGADNYFQPFQYTRIEGIDESTNLRIDGKTLVSKTDYTVQLMSAEKSFSAPAVFVGYGVTAKKDKDGKDIDYDDYAGVDVTGKVALALRFEPTDAEGKSRLAKEGSSDHASILTKARLAASKGAVAFLYVHPPDHHGTELLLASDRRGAGGGISIPVIQISQRAANELLKSSNAPDLRSLQKDIVASFKARSIPLDKSEVGGAVQLKRATHNLRNVAALLPGKGRRANEYIVVGAHYDHLGKRGQFPGTTDKIHYGADDNASGTAGLLELARMFSRSSPPPRSLIFIAFSGEEMGLLGSKHYAEHPLVPLEKTVAMLNLDMIGRVSNNTIMIGGAGTSAAFDMMLQRADAKSPLTLSTRWRDGRAPSDITSFVNKGIPGIMFFSGLHADYHRPTDTPDKVNYKAQTQVVDLAADIIDEIARMDPILLTFTPPPPSTRPTTRSTTGPSTRLATRPSTGDPNLRAGGASLGVMPDYGLEGIEGVRISGATPGSAAAKAGLKAGDTLTHFDGKALKNLYDYMDALNAATPGKTIKIQILRDGKPMTLEATPTARGG